MAARQMRRLLTESFQMWLHSDVGVIHTKCGMNEQLSIADEWWGTVK